MTPDPKKLADALADYDAASDAILGKHIDTLAQTARSYQRFAEVAKGMADALKEANNCWPSGTSDPDIIAEPLLKYNALMEGK